MSTPLVLVATWSNGFFAFDHFASQGALYRRPVDRDGPLSKIEDGLPQWLDGIADTLSQDPGRSWSRHGDALPIPSSTLVHSEAIP